MAFRYDDIDQTLRDSIEKGVVAIRRINMLEDFQNWLQVGQSCIDMRVAAMRLAYANQPKGRAYNDAYKVIAEQVPDLARIDKTTRSHAVWLAEHREDIVEWHQRLPENIRRQVNHPTTAWRRWQREHAVPTGEDGEKPAASGGLRAEVARLQEERDALAAKLERFGNDADNAPLLHRNSAVNEAIAVLREFFSTSKGAAIAAGWMASYKADKAAAPKVKRGARVDAG